jgi:hypothetical protein
MQSRWFVSLQRLVTTPGFSHFFLGLIVFNGVVCLPYSEADMLSRHNGHREQSLEFWGTVELLFSLAYVLECLLKVLGLGPVTYWRSRLNQFDFAATWSTVTYEAYMALHIGGEAPASVHLHGSLHRGDPRVIRSMLLLRLVRVLRLFAGVRQFRTIWLTFVSTVPRLMTLFGALWVIMYSYALIGVQVGQAARRARSHQSPLAPALASR